MIIKMFTVWRSDVYLKAQHLAEESNLEGECTFSFYWKRSVFLCPPCVWRQVVFSDLLSGGHQEKHAHITCVSQVKMDDVTTNKKVITIWKKLMLWKEHFQNRLLEMFPYVCDFFFFLNKYAVCQQNISQ